MRARYETEARPGAPPGGFADVYERYFADIHGYVASRLGRDVADDVAADTFVIALRKHADFDPARGPVRAWLYGIATNLVAQHRRAERRRYQALARAAVQERTAGREACEMSWAATDGVHPRLASALAGLSPEERDVLLLVALADLSVRGHLSCAQAPLRNSLLTAEPGPPEDPRRSRSGRERSMNQLAHDPCPAGGATAVG